jgi:hypothetical protein
VADEYTPTTAEICQVWVKATPVSGPEGRAEFTRWLAAHDREVAAKTLRDAADEVLRRRALVRSSGDVRDDETWDNGNMSAEATIRARADRIELQASEKGASDGEQ